MKRIIGNYDYQGIPFEVIYDIDEGLPGDRHITPDDKPQAILREVWLEGYPITDLLKDSVIDEIQDNLPTDV